MEQEEPLTHNKERKDAAKAGLTPPKPKETVEKPAKKEHVAPKKPAEPKEPSEPKPKKEKPAKKPLRKTGNIGDDTGQVKTKSKAAKPKPRNIKNDNNPNNPNPF